MNDLTLAEKALKKLGITEPHEIDLEVVAWDQGAKIRMRPLVGCEARILGNGNKSIISINDQSSYERQRFSIGHELGHWNHHRGRDFVCRAADIGSHGNRTRPEERQADEYSANLLMPNYIFTPLARSYRRLDFNTVKEIADAFKTSLTATAIRLIESNIFPAILICHGQGKRKWFKRAKDIPHKWFPRETLEIETKAFDVMFGEGVVDHRQHHVSAEAWFDRYGVDKYEVLEHSAKISDSTVLTLLEFDDDEMLD